MKQLVFVLGYVLMGVSLGVAQEPATRPASTAPATTRAALQVDLSSPRATLFTVYAAMRAGDVAGVKRCIVFDNPRQSDVFDVTLGQLIAPLMLMHAMENRFGAAGRKPFTEAALDKSIGDLVEKVKTAEIKVKGDTAEVSEKKEAVNPNVETELSGVMLRKQGAEWKVVADTFSDLSSDVPASQLRIMRALRDAEIEASEVTLARLERGEFKTVEEAYSAYQARLQAASRAATTRGRP